MNALALSQIITRVTLTPSFNRRLLSLRTEPGVASPPLHIHPLPSFESSLFYTYPFFLRVDEDSHPLPGCLPLRDIPCTETIQVEALLELERFADLSGPIKRALPGLVP